MISEKFHPWTVAHELSFTRGVRLPNELQPLWNHRVWPWWKRLHAFSILPNYLSVSVWALLTFRPTTKWPDCRHSPRPAVPRPRTSSTRTLLWLLITTATWRVKEQRQESSNHRWRKATSWFACACLCWNWSDIMNYSRFSAHTDITSIKLQHRPRQLAPQMSRLLRKCKDAITAKQWETVQFLL